MKCSYSHQQNLYALPGSLPLILICTKETGWSARYLMKVLFKHLSLHIQCIQNTTVCVYLCSAAFENVPYILPYCSNKYKLSVTTYYFQNHPIYMLEGQLCRLIYIDSIAKMFKSEWFRNKTLDATVPGEVKTKSYKIIQASFWTDWTYKYSCFRHFPRRIESHWRKKHLWAHMRILCIHTDTYIIFMLAHGAISPLHWVKHTGS